jgi:hypothetical protein
MFLFALLPLPESICPGQAQPAGIAIFLAKVAQTGLWQEK